MALASFAGGRYVTVESCRFREIMTEQLPVELREQFTEMREMDLQVQNTIDDLDIRVKQFFMTCRKAKPEWKEQQYKQIREEYQKALEDADEKVTIASQIYDLVDRHLRKLDQELSKFKMELEADSAGITEILEQRSLRLDEPLNPPSPAVNNQYTPTHSHPSIGQKRQFSHVDSLSNELVNGDHLAVPTIRDYPSYSPLGAYNQMSPSPKASAPQPPSPSLIALGSSGTGSAAVAVAAAQAVSTTLQMNRRGGGTLKAPYVTALGGALGGLSGATGSLNGIPSSSGSINLSSYDTTHTSVVGNITLPLVPSEAQSAMSGSSSKQKRQRNKGPALQTSTAAAAAQVQADQAAAAAAAVPDWVYDPNEPRYCLCNQVSYGEMVGCDNSECPIEWFHYGCVGITDPPKGKWYCPQCSVQIKQKRGGRHK